LPQFLTLTPNPALDLSTAVDRVAPTHKLRCAAPVLHPGGGGINVARVLARLGAEVLALFPAGGVTGRRLGELLQAEGVAAEALPIVGETRESFAVHESTSGLDYRFVLPGPELTQAEWQACLDRAVALARGARLVVASGSLPPGMPQDFLARLARLLAAQGVPLAVDSSGAPLAEALAAGVELVKPSLRELQELAGQELPDLPARKAACQALVRSGQARVVALSLGEQGALLVREDGAWQAPALPVPVASTIGAGDSFLAGLVHAWDAGPEAALREAMAASAAALLSLGTALCRAEDVARLRTQVRISRC
jgi:6-phosphofructokinase 2